VEDETQGFQITMAIFAVVSIVLFWTTFATTKERVISPPEKNVSLKNDIKILFSNKPWVVLCFAGILTLTSVALKGAVTIHYFKYYVQDDGSAFFWVLDQTSLFLAANSLALIAGVCCTKFLSDRYEKKYLLIALSIVTALSGIALFFVPPDLYWSMMLVSCVGSVAAGPTAPLVWSMYGDVADYGEWRFNRRTTGLVFSASMFAQKFGLTIGAGLSGWLLAIFGYVANETQTDESLMGIRMLFTFIPAAVAILNIVALSFYNLTDKEVMNIEQALEQRREAT
jgi:GPH family glycoside/pentoside/hexuronide:cation symporter